MIRLTPEEVEKFLSIIGNLRNRIIFQLLLEVGLHLTDLLSLRCEDVKLDPEHRVLTLLRRGAAQTIPLSASLTDLMQRYLNSRIGIGTSPYLFVSGPYADQPLRRQGLYITFQHYVEKAGWPPEKIQLGMGILKHAGTPTLEQVESLLVNRRLPTVARYVSADTLRNGIWRLPYYTQLFSSPFILNTL